MNWREYQAILKKGRPSHATGGGDNSVDPNPAKNPNDFLAPLANNKAMHIAVAVISYLVIVYLVIVITKKLSYKLPSIPAL